MMPLFRPLILHFDSLPSTNTEAAQQAMRGAPEGLCIVAREQTVGRGRRERLWASPADGGLYFSIVLRPRLELVAWPLLTLMAALAVTDALVEACAITELDIKWPNDIVARERKVCGILAETVETAAGRACIVGIGINLREGALPPDLREVATSVEALAGARPEREAVLRALVNSIEHRYMKLTGPGGAQETVRAWSRRSSYAEGKHVRVATGTEIFEGVTRGLEPDGALRVETAGGTIKVVRAGDVTALRAMEIER